jgi:hypothetical protein
VTDLELCEAFERMMYARLAEISPEWRSGHMTLRYDENAAVLDRWTVTMGGRYSKSVQRGPNLAAALAIEEPEARP